jgi:hypothetical protein
VIASMQQRGSLTISSEVKSISMPLVDFNGDVYGHEFDVIRTGEFKISLNNPSKEEIAALRLACIPGHKMGIQNLLEHLAQIKPIGRSGVKQATVIAFLCCDLVDEGVSEFVVNELCREWRKQTESKFFPDHGDFLASAISRMKEYKAALREAEAPTVKEPVSDEILPEPKKDDAQCWNDMDEEGRAKLMAEIKEYCQRLREAVLRVLKVPEGFYEEYWANHELNQTKTNR